MSGKNHFQIINELCVFGFLKTDIIFIRYIFRGEFHNSQDTFHNRTVSFKIVMIHKPEMYNSSNVINKSCFIFKKIHYLIYINDFFYFSFNHFGSCVCMCVLNININNFKITFNLNINQWVICFFSIHLKKKKIKSQLEAWKQYMLYIYIK